MLKVFSILDISICLFVECELLSTYAGYYVFLSCTAVHCQDDEFITFDSIVALILMHTAEFHEFSHLPNS